MLGAGQAITGFRETAAVMNTVVEKFKEVQRLEQKLVYAPHPAAGVVPEELAVIHRELRQIGPVSHEGETKQLAVFSDLLLLAVPYQGEPPGPPHPTGMPSVKEKLRVEWLLPSSEIRSITMPGSSLRIEHSAMGCCSLSWAEPQEPQGKAWGELVAAAKAQAPLTDVFYLAKSSKNPVDADGDDVPAPTVPAAPSPASASPTSARPRRTGSKDKIEVQHHDYWQEKQRQEEERLTEEARHQKAIADRDARIRKGKADKAAKLATDVEVARQAKLIADAETAKAAKVEAPQQAVEIKDGKNLTNSVLENQRELDKAKCKYERMKKKLDKHPHGAMKALATLAAALSLSLNRSPEIDV